MPADASIWYDSHPDAGARYQGDVLNGIPVVLMPPHGDGSWIALRPSPPITVPEAKAGRTPKSFRPHADGSQSNPWAGGNELVLALATKAKVMLVTQTCDLDHRNAYQVAPIFDVSKLDEMKLESLRAGGIKYMLHLPSDPPRLPEESYVDLSQITTVHKSYFRAAQLIERLTPRAIFELQSYLAKLHGRPFGFDVRDTVPQSAEYLCINCFLARAAIQNVVHVEGARFSPCPSCDASAKWIKYKDCGPA